MAPATAEESLSNNLLGESIATARHRQDAIKQISLKGNASARSVKGDNTIVANQDSLELGKNRRDITQKQMNNDHPLARSHYLPQLQVPL